MTKTALILGVSGQDGAYLAQLLLDRDYVVHGASRDAAHPLPRLHTLGIRDRVTLHDANDLRSVIDSIAPDEIYNLSGLSSVARSFADPAATRASIVDAQLRLLEIVRSMSKPPRLYHAASSECFGDTPPGSASDESTPFAPRSPYAAAKAEAHDATVHYRESHGLFAVSGILFNHESPLRGETFVTKKLVAAAAKSANGDPTRIAVGDISVARDWGYAKEYVEAMWLMLQQSTPDDYVIATGESHRVEEVAAAIFAEFDLDYREHIAVDPTFFRPSDLRHSCGNPSRAARQLGWSARTKFGELVKLLAEAERAS